MFERKIRDQLGRMLSAGGFDPARDIEAITVNRWSHGYAYGYDPATSEVDFLTDWPEERRTWVRARRPFRPHRHRQLRRGGKRHDRGGHQPGPSRG